MSIVYEESDQPSLLVIINGNTAEIKIDTKRQHDVDMTSFGS